MVPIRASETSLPVPRKFESSTEKLEVFRPPALRAGLLPVVPAPPVLRAQLPRQARAHPLALRGPARRGRLAPASSP